MRRRHGAAAAWGRPRPRRRRLGRRRCRGFAGATQHAGLAGPERRLADDPGLALDVQAGLEPALEQHDHAGGDQVQHAGGQEHGDVLEVGRDDLLAAKRELADGDHRRQRRVLDDDDRLVGHRGRDRAHRLRDHHALQDLPALEAERRRRVTLGLLDRQQSAADYLRHECDLVEREADDRGEHRARADPDQRQYVVPEQQLQQDRRPPHHPDEGDRQPADDPACVDMRISATPSANGSAAKNDATEISTAISRPFHRNPSVR